MQTGLQSFKRLLDEILSPEGDRSKLEILDQYLEVTKPRHVNDEAVFLSDIMEMWSFAVEVKNEGVMSSVAVVLALTLQAVSGSLQMVSHGMGICQTLLQERQLKSITKNLSAEKAKGFIISPTLRLLREVVSLDGGAFAKKVFRARHATFAFLPRNLELAPTGDNAADPTKTSVRTNAARYLLTCLKYLHSDGRKELLSQRELLSHLTFMLKTDPPNLVLEILEGLKAHVLADDKIPREVKLRNFNTKSLQRILGLYAYGTSSQSDEEKAAVSQKAHEFLIYACTTPNAGVLYPSTGLYPKPIDDEFTTQPRRSTVAGLEGSLSEAKYSEEIPVYNFVLSEFAQKLRPWSNMRHSELLVAIFEAAPELIASFFINNRAFSFAPKLSMTWIGYASFLFSTMSIPLPDAFGDKTKYSLGPPPISILLDNIIPLPIERKVITRCLDPSSNLTSFFATRILVLALEKLATATEMLQGPSRSGLPLWTDAFRRLVDGFCQRIPEMKEIVLSYRRVPPANLLHKTLASRLLRLYYEVVPRVALAANFDVSPTVIEILHKLNQQDVDQETKAFGVMELENLVAIASHSPGMRWFAKVDKVSDGSSSLPFTALIRLLCDDSQDSPSRQIKKILRTVALDNQIVSAASGLQPLLQTLRCATNLAEIPDMTPVWSFLDNCINRCASSPIKYLDLLSYSTETPSEAVSLLNVTIVEQLPFATASADKEQRASLAKFLSLYFTAADASQEDSELVGMLYEKIREHFATVDLDLFELGVASDIEFLEGYELPEDNEIFTKPPSSKSTSFVDSAQLRELLHVAEASDLDTSALTKWSSKSVEDLIEDNHIPPLLTLLASPDLSIRKEAHTSLLKLTHKIRSSTYEDRDAIWLLLSELCESAKPFITKGNVPSAFIAFATHALEVLRNPLHPLYPKVCSFLTKSPVWGEGKIPLAHEILHGAPSEDDRYYTEVSFLLSYLLASLLTPFDLTVFHKKLWFEKILALGSNPHLRQNLRTRIMRIVYRASEIEGGSTTLITRFGVVSWLDAQRGSAVGTEKGMLGALMRRVWETADQERVTRWSRGGVLKIVEGLPRE